MLESEFLVCDVLFGEICFEVNGFNCGDVVWDVSFGICCGEILGLMGFIGFGCMEIVWFIFGVD